MIKKFSTFFALSLTLFIGLLSGCGKDSLFSSSDVPSIDQSIFVVSENFSGQPYLSGSPSRSAYLDTNEVVKFWAVYSLDGQYLTKTQSDNYILGTFWDVEEELINLTAFRVSFNTPGYRQVFLRSTDYLNDTISDTLDVFVNTPISIELVAPKDKYNLVDPLAEEGVTLSWTVSGTDEWESSTCAIYASTDRDSVWNTLIDQNDCSKGTQIEGSLVQDIVADSSLTIYWAVQAANFTDDNFLEVASSPIYQFSTKFINTDSAIVAIPIVYNGLKETDEVHTQILLTDASGDTLKFGYQNKSSNTVKMKVKPQSGLKLTFQESTRTEYREASLQIDVPAATLISTDTVYFNDSFPPQVAPLKEKFAPTDKLKFIALDNGSGIDATRTSYILGDDTVHIDYVNSILSFDNPCKVTCSIQISASDNAKNQSPETYWRIDMQKDAIFILGPYAKKEESDE